jgi:RNA polymerase sigma-70 factor (ECF subfamily)
MNPSFENQDDDQLIARALDGETEAFGALIRKYQPRLYNSMVYFLKNESEAEDVVQDAFVLALTKLDSFKGNSQFYTWLYRIAHNTAISKLRRKRPTVSLDRRRNETGDDAKLEMPGDEPLPSDRMERSEQASQLMQAMNLLSEEHRSILVLREMEEMDYEAIADVLQLPVGTVRSRLHRARLNLREILEKADLATEAKIVGTRKK